MLITPQNLIEAISNFEEFVPKINFPKKIFHYGLFTMHLWLFFVAFFFSGPFVVLSLFFAGMYLFYFTQHIKMWRLYKLSAIKLSIFMIFTFYPTIILGTYIRNNVLSFIF